MSAAAASSEGTEDPPSAGTDAATVDSPAGKADAVTSVEEEKKEE